MPIHLPDLGETHCKSMLACGMVETRSKNALKVLHGEKNQFVIEYERHRQSFHAFVLFGGGHLKKPTNHFHVEITRKAESELIDHNWVVCSEDEIQQYFDVVLGKSITVRVTGSFEIASRKIRPHSWAYDVVSMRKQMRKTSGQVVEAIVYRVKSPFTRQLNISFSEDGKKLETKLSTQARGVIHEDYLTSLLTFLETDFRLGVLAEAFDGILDQE
jgi:hypothetical protein